MSVLVIRPDEQAHELCQQLGDLHIPAFPLSLVTLIEGSELSALKQALSTSDILIAVSQHAVSHAAHYLHHHQGYWPSSLAYIAIGQKTAQLLSKYTQQTIHCPTIHDSEHLLELDPLQDIHGLSVLILRGNGGRELIADTLRQRGAAVRNLETYQRCYTAFDVDIAIENWRQRQLSQIVVSSGEQLSYFFSQLSPAQQNWIKEKQLFVPSQRVAQLAQELGFHRIYTVGSAMNCDFSAAIKAMYDRKST